ncbi:MAG: hypothetical protein AABW88_04655 [Nanoarchaeota archaeon]
MQLTMRERLNQITRHKLPHMVDSGNTLGKRNEVIGTLEGIIPGVIVGGEIAIGTPFESSVEFNLNIITKLMQILFQKLQGLNQRISFVHLGSLEIRKRSIIMKFMHFITPQQI